MREGDPIPRYRSIDHNTTSTRLDAASKITSNDMLALIRLIDAKDRKIPIDAK
jgi:hypothetical protein